MATLMTISSILGVIFGILLKLGGIVFILIGMFLVFHVARPQRLPADQSNRLNKFRLIWFAISREDKFVGPPEFDWLKGDEWDNLNP